MPSRVAAFSFYEGVDRTARSEVGSPSSFESLEKV